MNTSIKLKSIDVIVDIINRLYDININKNYITTIFGASKKYNINPYEICNIMKDKDYKLFNLCTNDDNIKTVEFYIDIGIDINYRDSTSLLNSSNLRTALLVAIKYQCINIINLLVFNDVNAYDYENIHLLLQHDNCNVEILELLLEYNIHLLNMVDKNNNTPLHIVIMNYLKADLNENTIFRPMPLIEHRKNIVSPQQYLKCIDILLSKQANITLKNNDGKSALDYIDNNQTLYTNFRKYI